MANYYNEFDAYAAEWIRNLIKAGHVPDGEVDTRSIVDVAPDDLRGFTQCHFFAGILGWPLAIRISGYSETESIWTGSCPCQPFSVAGKGKGVDDERHLWPHFFRLIRACKPKVVMGEQVAGKAGYGWFDGVRSDLEAEGYACDGVDIPACAVNAPHIRQRLYWVARNMADTCHDQPQERKGNERECEQWPAQRRREFISSGSGAGSRDTQWHYAERDGRHTATTKDRSDGGFNVANSNNSMRETRGGNGLGIVASGPSERSATHSGGMYDMAHTGDIGTGRVVGQASDGGREALDAGSEGLRRADGARSAGGADARDTVDMADADDAGREGWPIYAQRADEQSAWSRGVEWRRGADGKTRRVKSGVRLLVDGMPGRVGLLRIGGNAIVAPLAAEIIKSFMESEYGE
jgi:DNA (cytosine-5)-methyltransferase 1